MPKPKSMFDVSKTLFAGGGWGRWAAERAALRSALTRAISDSNSLPHADPELRKTPQYFSVFSLLNEPIRRTFRREFHCAASVPIVCGMTQTIALRKSAQRLVGRKPYPPCEVLSTVKSR